MTQRTYDAVVVGAGINGLVAASELAGAGWRVAVVDERDKLGGFIASDELTVPGFVHDTFSSWHPLFIAGGGYAELGEDLHRHGLSYLNSDGLVTASVSERGAVVAHRDPEATTAAFEHAQDASAYSDMLTQLGQWAPHVFGALGSELRNRDITRLGYAAARGLRIDGLTELLRVSVQSGRGLVRERFRGFEVDQLWSPWLLHVGLTPDHASGGLMLPVMAFTMHEIGLPVVAGAVARHRPGRAAMQIHLALEHPVAWTESRLGEVPLVHISDGAGSTSVACAQAEAGLLPATPTVVVGQQYLLDSTRAPKGKATLWLQLQEVPWAPIADAADELDITQGWTPQLADAYADRVLTRIERYAPGLRAATHYFRNPNRQTWRSFQRMSAQPAPEPPPTVDLTDLTEISDGIWIIPDRRVRLVPNIGIITGDRSVLVVDTGMGPKNATTVLNKSLEIANGRQVLLTVTHFHPEHGFGAQVFVGEAAIVYNKSQRDELRGKGAAYVDLFRTFGSGVEDHLEGVELIDPDIVYESQLTIDLGGREVSLIEVGPAHTRGDQIVWLPEERIVFAGDLLETGVFPIFPYFPPDDTDVDGNKWIQVLRRIAALEPKVVVTGHCELGDVDLIRATEDYLLDMGRRVAQFKEVGMSVDDVVAQLEPPIRTAHPDWREENWIESGIRCFYDTGFTVDSQPTA